MQKHLFFKLAQIPAVYVPSLYDVSYLKVEHRQYNPNKPGVPKNHKRIVAAFTAHPLIFLVTNVEIIHDACLSCSCAVAHAVADLLPVWSTVLSDSAV
jgi:hypothetical protein